MERIDSLPSILGEVDVDVFYHLAWFGATGIDRENIFIQEKNIRWSLDAVRVCLELGAKRFVSTGTVCEEQCEWILRNKSQCRNAYYLLAKKHTYELLSVYCKKNNLPMVWCTFYHPVGKYNKKEQIIINTINKLKLGETPQFGPADKWFDVISVEDLAYGLYLAGDNHLSEDKYFIGSGYPRLLRDYLEEIKNVVAPQGTIDIGFFEDDSPPLNKDWLDCSSFCDETGFKCKKSFYDYLRECI